MSSWPIPRSLLYVPMHKAKMVARAHERGAHALILDLEDGVPDSAKEEARSRLPVAVPELIARGTPVVVRINAPWALAWRDLEAAVAAGARSLMVPKVESAGQLQVIEEYLAQLEAEFGAPSLELIALVESARGLQAAPEIAAATPRLRALVPGNEDLAVSLGIEPEPELLLPAIWPMVVAGKANGLSLLGTIGSGAHYRDLEGFRKLVEFSARRGFEGTTCIHPSQVGVANEVYQADEGSIEWARAVVAAFEDAGGDSVGVAGQMVDRPVYLRAKRLLEDSAGADGGAGAAHGVRELGAAEGTE